MSQVLAGNGPSAGALGSLAITEAVPGPTTSTTARCSTWAEGETKVETFVVKSVDGTEHTVTITITGVNDAAVITGSDTRCGHRR